MSEILSDGERLKTLALVLEANAADGDDMEDARAVREAADKIERLEETVGAQDRSKASHIIRIAELQAIVEKLPVTADGVPVVPGMEVWFWDDRIDVPQRWTLHDVHGFEIAGAYRHVDGCYSTREAIIDAG